MEAKVFTAKLEGACAICGKEMKGTRIALDRKTKQYAHADCIWPKKVNANSTTKKNGTGPLATTESPVASANSDFFILSSKELALIDEEINSNFAYALKSALNFHQLGITDINSIPELFAEINERARQRQAIITSLRMHKDARANRKAYGKGSI